MKGGTTIWCISPTLLDFVSFANLPRAESGSGKYSFRKFSFTLGAQSESRILPGDLGRRSVGCSVAPLCKSGWSVPPLQGSWNSPLMRTVCVLSVFQLFGKDVLHYRVFADIKAETNTSGDCF